MRSSFRAWILLVAVTLITELRFGFDTVDDVDNAQLGWMIDDVTVNARTP